MQSSSLCGSWIKSLADASVSSLQSLCRKCAGFSNQSRPVCSVNCSHPVFTCLSLFWPFADCELNVSECSEFPASEGYSDWLALLLFSAQHLYGTTVSITALLSPPSFSPSPPGLFTTSLHLHFASVWTSSHPLSGRQREAIKWEEKQLAAPLCPVWGNEIARPIVACNGEQVWS